MNGRGVDSVMYIKYLENPNASFKEDLVNISK
jgi:hypothetical protein